MQLSLGFDQVNFPFVIAMNSDLAQVFLVNVNTHKRVPLISLKQIHKFDAIYDIQQTSKLQDPTKALHYSNLQEIVIHFKLNQHNKDGSDDQLIYCNLKLSTEAILMLVKS